MMELIRNAELDYRFGWRCLLPTVDGNQVISHGLCNDELKWWTQAQHISFVDESNKNVDGSLIALDFVTQDIITNSISNSNPSWICAWGTGKAVRHLRSQLNGFLSIREYALLPSDNPRVVVPLHSSQTAVAGLRLHRPGRLSARIALLVARGLAKLGNYSLLRQQVLLIAGREEDLMVMPACVNVFIMNRHINFALYLGAPDDNRKTVILPLGDESPRFILKVAETTKSRAALQNEARTLSSMGATSLANQVPKFIGLESIGERLTLVQEFRQRQSISHTRMTSAVLNFLAKMSEIERKEVALVDWMKCKGGVAQIVSIIDLSCDAANACSNLSLRLEVLANEGKHICLHRCHGDFAPWNFVWTDQGLFVYDWEESCEQGLALSDVFYNSLSLYLYVYKKPDAKEALDNALKLGVEVAKQSVFFVDLNIDYAEEVRIYFALWILGRINQLPFYGELAVQLDLGWK